MSYEKFPRMAAESLETSRDLENPDADAIEQFAGLGTPENYDQSELSGSQPEIIDANERLQRQLQLATELMDGAHREAIAHQSDESLIREDTRVGATNSSISNAKSAREAGDTERADSYLIAGLIIDWKYQAKCDGFVQQAVTNGLAGELLGVAKDNSELVLKDPDSDHTRTVSAELGNKLDLLELVVDHRVGVGEHSLGPRQELTDEDRRDQITRLDYEDLIVLGQSPEVNQRDPELTKLAIKAAIGKLQVSPRNYFYNKGSPSADIGDLAKAQPDIFKNELDDEFQGLRQQRSARPEDRSRRGRPSLNEGTLDAVVVDLWANGSHDVAAKMLTASSRETELVERAGRSPEVSRWNNPARVEEVIGEISEHIHQRQAALHNAVSQYAVELDHSLASNRLGPDSDTLSRSLKSALEPDNVDNSTDPERYVELVTDAIPELITGLDTDQVGEVCEGLRSVGGPNQLLLAEAIRDPQTISSLTDETFGPEMRRLVREHPRRLQEIATIIEDKRFKDIVEDCQFVQPDKIIRDLASNSAKSIARRLGSEKNLPDIDDIVAAFSDETNLVQALSQIPESVKSDFLCHAISNPDQAISLATTLTDDGVTKLLVRNDQEKLFSSADILLQWEPDAAPQKSRELLKAFELIGGESSTIGDDRIKKMVQERILNSPEDYLKTATELAETLTNIELAEQLAQDDQEKLFNGDKILREWGLEAAPQKSRDLLEAFKLIGETSSTIGNDEIKKMAQRHTLDSSEDYLKTATEWAHVMTDEAVTELLAQGDQEKLRGLDDDILLQWGPGAAPQKSRELLEAFKLIGEASSIADDYGKKEFKRRILNSSEDYLKTATELAEALTNIELDERLAQGDQELRSRIIETVLEWEPEVAPQKSRELLESFKLVAETSSTIGNDTMGNDEIEKMVRDHIFDSPEDYLKTATELAEALTNIELAGQLAQDDQKLLFRIVETVLQWEPEIAPQKSRELLEALTLINTPAIMGNPSIRDHVEDKILNGSEDNYLEKANKLVHILSYPRDLWKDLYLFSTEVMGIDPGLDEDNVHLISVLPKLKLDLRQLDEKAHFIDSVEGFDPVNIADMTDANFRSLLRDSDLPSQAELEEFKATAIPFKFLNQDTKRQIYAYQLFETVQQTRSKEHKAAADERNRQATLQSDRPTILVPGDFIHSTSPNFLSGLLQDGNIAGESRKIKSAEDAFPFNVDVSVVENSQATPAETIEDLISIHYGSMSIVYDRESAWMRNSTKTIDRDAFLDGQPVIKQHGLTLGGVPSTEISAIVVDKPTAPEVIEASRAIAENGFYIPLYDGSGQLLLSPQGYDDLRTSYNIDQTTIDTVLDNHLALGELGSNGSEYLLLEDEGLDRYYIKFGGQRRQNNEVVNGEVVNPVDHVWTEFLADEIYRRAGVAVPETKIVQLEGRIGKASRWLDEPADASSANVVDIAPVAEVTTREGGFVVDAWLGNWDIALDPANIIGVDGASYRIDNGNALDIRAQGGKKSEQLWSDTVAELEAGQGVNNLGLGMRHMYPGLAAPDFAQQVDRLTDRFSDSVIDEMVDSVRRNADDRDSLKQTLKARRDYIVNNRGRIMTELSQVAEQEPLIEQTDKYKDKDRSIEALTASGLIKPFGESGADVVVGNHESKTSIDEVSPHKPGAVLLDLRVNHEFGGGVGEGLTGLLRQTLPEAAEAVPFDFEDRGRIDKLAGILGVESDDYIPVSDLEINQMARDIEVPPASLDRLLSAHNSRLFLAENPAEAAYQALSFSGGFNLADQAGRRIPCSTDYVRSALDSLGVVGVIDRGDPAGTEVGSDVIHLFNAGSVDKKEAVEAQRQTVATQMESVDQALASSFEANSPLLDLLNHNPHASPEAIVGSAKTVPGFAEIFASDTGVWEGYTLAEHSETVLRNYDQSFAEDLPTSSQKLAKLALLTHDIGKPVAEAQAPRDKQVEHDSNLHYSRQFLERIGVDDRAIAYIHGLYDASKDYAKAYLSANQSAFNAVRDKGGLVLAEIGIEPTAEAIEGFLEATSVLFACDGGAYTSAATTRLPDGTHYRNADTFNSSFIIENSASKKFQLRPDLKHQPPAELSDLQLELPDPA